MDPELIKQVWAFAAGVGAAAIAALANAFSARQKIREVELSYQLKLRDSYLENARKMSEQVYIPLAVAITRLSQAFDSLRYHIDYLNETAPSSDAEEFEAACGAYLLIVDDLLARGAGAYLTIAIDEALQSFNEFLQQSLVVDAPLRKLILEARLPFVPVFGAHVTTTRTLHLPATIRTAVNLGLGLYYHEELLAAPVASRAFEKRFQSEIIRLKSLVKEVTLGSRGPV